MLVKIPGILNTGQLKTVCQILDNADFVDGKLSAGRVASRIKNNRELDQESADINILNSIVMNSLVANKTYQAAVLPYRIASPFYACYTHGMSYGWHIDDPVMGPSNGRYRTDVSTTVFLNDPDEYQGGEIIIRTTFGETEIKLPAGFAIVYPSTSLHQVAEVTSGERRVAVTWTQSMVKDPAQRQILYDIDQVREQLNQQQPHSDDFYKLDTSYGNLFRMWSEI
ncbi:MAG: Fe2+-dependent dioxygenase [Methylococcales bacterium]|jgi:PKHD-type hydroxylase|nr:Fe2+-dependent dioxygenase [Methylococcales bacterium]MBT7408230.1 Fe2+-dependent dioxygenase [Methylococcales bacterium]